MKIPKVSIVTINYNDFEGLEKDTKKAKSLGLFYSQHF